MIPHGNSDRCEGVENTRNIICIGNYKILTFVFLKFSSHTIHKRKVRTVYFEIYNTLRGKDYCEGRKWINIQFTSSVNSIIDFYNRFLF